MDSNYIYTKRLMHLDVKVLFTLLLVFLLSSVFLGYSVIKKNKTIPCRSIDILIFGQKNLHNKIYYADQQLIFRVPSNIDDKVTWDFGDNSPKVNGAGTRHTFTEEKIFSVTALINGRCSSSTKITVKKKEDLTIDSSGNNVQQHIVGNSEALVDEPVTFSAAIQASSYRWSINRSGYPNKDSKDATYTFKTSGIYTVRLMVDDDRRRQYEFTVSVKPIERFVNDKSIEFESQTGNGREGTHGDDTIEKTKGLTEVKPPPPPPPPKPKFVITSDDNLKDHLQNYVCGFKTIENLQPYFCDLNNTPVTIITEKNKKISTTMVNLCAALGCNKNGIQIISVKADRNNDQCITGLLITFDKIKRKKACLGN